MKRCNYYQPSTKYLGKKRRVVRRQGGASFFSRVIILLFLAAAVAGGVFAANRGYQWIVQAKLTDWKPREVVVTGVSGEFYKNILALSKPHEGQPFSIKDAVALRDRILTAYPMLKSVSVKRGLIKGVLTVTAERRTPVAKFVLPDKTLKYIDGDSVIYTDPNPDSLQPVPSVELEGEIPDKISPELVDLVESTLKLKRDLDFSSLQMNLTYNTIKLLTPEGCTVDFGQAVNLRNKAMRAAQIMAAARGKYPAPFSLDFRFFENGQVFLIPGKAPVPPKK